MNRDEAIQRIRKALRQRSGRSWSVRGGRGTAWGWITVSSPPARQALGCLNIRDHAELSRLFGERVHPQGLSIPSSTAYYNRYVELAETGSSDVRAEPYWD